MANKFRSAMKVITGEINKHRFLNNATSAIGTATEKAHEKLNNMQNMVTSKYDVIAKQINKEMTIIRDPNGAPLEPRAPLPKGLVKWWQWYQELTGLDNVEFCRQQVIIAQDKLFKCQDERRQLNRQAAMINEGLKEIYGELLQVKRDDPRYVQLTIVENKNLQDQAKITAQLNLLEKDERDHFTLLATAIKEYHDSQTTNAQKYKYLSILASAAIAIISLTGSMVYNNRRIMDVRHVVDVAQKRNESIITNSFHSLEEQFSARFSEVLEKLESRTESPKVHGNSVNLNSEEQNAAEYSFLPSQLTYIKIGLAIACFYVIKLMYG